MKKETRHVGIVKDDDRCWACLLNGSESEAVYGDSPNEAVQNLIDLYPTDLRGSEIQTTKLNSLPRKIRYSFARYSFASD